MLSDGFITPTTKDSTIFMAEYPVKYSSGRVSQRGAAGLYNIGLKSARSLHYNSSVVPYEKWHVGRQYFAKMAFASLKATLSFGGAFKKTAEMPRGHPWGFKHPRTALVLPYALDVLGTRFKFVQVVRDGKDVAMGENQKLFSDHCGRYYGKSCFGGLLPRVQFWADLNLEVTAWCREHLHPNRFLIVRIEDLVVGNAECFDRIFDFLRLPENPDDARTSVVDPDRKKKMVWRAINENKGHTSHYLGQKFSTAEKNHMYAAIKNDPKATHALNFYGYDTDEFGISGKHKKSCLDL